MKVKSLLTNPLKYSSNAYLILGDWNRLADVNTLIDTGSDNYILNEIKNINKGFGKKALEHVIITHSHFDHYGCIYDLKSSFDAKILSYSKYHGSDRTLEDGEEIKAGDQVLKVIHTPGHSSDSICLYCEKERVLFSGDTHFNIYSTINTYSEEYITSIEKLSKLKIDIIYPGHGFPISGNPGHIIKNTYKLLTTEHRKLNHTHIDGEHYELVL